MSNTTLTCEQACDVMACSGAVEMIVEPKLKELGGFSVRRVLPTVQRKMVGPWIFFDHMGPAFFTAGEGVNVPPHPHIGIATVTYLFEGELLHRDSVGSCQVIRPGDINLMVAGRGITHSERERPEAVQQGRTIHGLQLWLSLPASHEETPPSFHHYPNAEIPSVEIGGVSVRVMMGQAYGQTSPITLFSSTLYFEANLMRGQSLMLPDTDERAVYMVSGSLTVGNTVIPPFCMALLEQTSDVTLHANEDARIVVFGGEHFDKRFIEWNFVSTRKERINQAKADWKAGLFPKVSGDTDEFIPLPE